MYAILSIAPVTSSTFNIRLSICWSAYIPFQILLIWDRFLPAWLPSRPIVTESVAWSACRSVCRSASLWRSWALRKRLNRSRCRLGCGLGSTGPLIRRWSWPPCEWVILRGKGRPTVKYRDYLPWAVEKRLNRSRCRLGYVSSSSCSFIKGCHTQPNIEA